MSGVVSVFNSDVFVNVVVFDVVLFVLFVVYYLFDDDDDVKFVMNVAVLSVVVLLLG